MVHKTYWHKLCKVTISYPRQSHKFTNAIKSLVIYSIKNQMYYQICSIILYLTFLKLILLKGSCTLYKQNHSTDCEFPAQMASNEEMFPCDDIIMIQSLTL